MRIHKSFKSALLFALLFTCISNRALSQKKIEIWFTEYYENDHIKVDYNGVTAFDSIISSNGISFISKKVYIILSEKNKLNSFFYIKINDTDFGVGVNMIPKDHNILLVNYSNRSASLTTTNEHEMKTRKEHININRRKNKH